MSDAFSVPVKSWCGVCFLLPQVCCAAWLQHAKQPLLPVDPAGSAWPAPVPLAGACSCSVGDFSSVFSGIAIWRFLPFSFCLLHCWCSSLFCVWGEFKKGRHTFRFLRSGTVPGCSLSGVTDSVPSASLCHIFFSFTFTK